MRVCVLLVAGAILVLAGLGQTQTLQMTDLVVYPAGRSEPVAQQRVTLSCAGPAVFADGVKVLTPPIVAVRRAGEWCLAELDATGLPPGAYTVMEAWAPPASPGEMSHVFVVPGPQPQPASKTCKDPSTGTTYTLHAGPPLERFNHTTASGRVVILARERALESAGFSVKFVPLTATLLGLGVTCR
jgi:hypothetical protein